MSGVLNLLLAGAASAIKDAYYNLTTLLLNTSSTNGAQNNTFLDSSTNNFTITRNGNTTQGTFTPFSQTGWSNYFGSSSNYLVVPANSNFVWSTGARTYEAWVYVTSAAANNAIFGLTNLSSSNTWELYINTSSQVVFRYFAGGAQTVTTTGTVPLNTWAHVAFVYDGTSAITIYIDGVSAGTGTKTGSPVTDNNQLCIGRTNVGGAGDVFFSGYISNVRFTTTAVYTSNFTPSTARLTSVTGTTLLTCQDNRFVDNSASPATITVNGTPSVQAFSPFAPTAAYDTAVVGGSGYFDGSGDYLTVADNANLELGSGDFTIECWINTTISNSGYVTAISKWGSSNQSYMIRAASTDIGAGWSFFYSTNGSNYFTVFGSAINDSGWHHVAITRSGDVFRTFTDGVLKNSTTDAVTLYNGTSAVTIGSGDGGANPFTGYISGVRIVKGTALYTATFTPPTAPPTAISNTQLLINSTNAGIYDSTAKNVLETVGNAQVSTTQAKWGTTSMYFDGTTDALFEPANVNYGYGTGDFTIEFWIRLAATTTQTLVSNMAGDASVAPHIYYSSGSGIRYYTNSADRITGGALSTGQWYHIALCRSGTSTKLFIDGTQTGSTYTDSNNYGTSNPLGVGDYKSPLSGASTLNGYIDDLRITKYARYTTTFTPPAAAFPVQ